MVLPLPLCLTLFFFFVFELIFVSNSLLHPLILFLEQGFSLVSSPNCVNRLLYLTDFKC
jgi:hypothetical protein